MREFHDDTDGPSMASNWKFNNRMPDTNRAESKLADVGKDMHKKCTRVGETHAPWRTCPECDKLYREDANRAERAESKLTMQDLKDCYDEIEQMATCLTPEQAWEELAKARKKFYKDRGRAEKAEMRNKLLEALLVEANAKLSIHIDQAYDSELLCAFYDSLIKRLNFPDNLPDDYCAVDDFLKERE